jgi:hypothetical protein
MNSPTEAEPKPAAQPGTEPEPAAPECLFITNQEFAAMLGIAEKVLSNT